MTTKYTYPEKEAFEPINVVAQMYDSDNWRGNVDYHHEALRRFWRDAWPIAEASRPDLGKEPNRLPWDLLMYAKHHETIDALAALTQDEVLAVLQVLKEDITLPLCLHVMARAVQLGWRPAHGECDGR